MAKIHYMKDKDGNTIYPVTHADAILGLEDVGSNVDLSDYQTKIDNNLVTQSKDLVGAINELFQNADSGKQLIANAIGEPVSADDTFQAMSDDINGLLSTFKTNMMNNGVVVESGDKFKALIDKIKGLTEGEGNKGIQFAEGTCDIGCTRNIVTNIPFNIDFTPTYLFLYVSSTIGFEINLKDLIISNLTEFSTISGYSIFVENITQNGCDIRMDSITPAERTLNVTNWYAIGVGEDDTTLRDSLASILENKGIDVTEEDDMASLITKVDTAFNNLVPKKIYLYNRGTEYTTITLGTSNGTQVKESDYLYISGAYFNGALTSGSMTISYTYNAGDENKYLYLDLDSSGGTLRIGSIYDGVSYTLGGRGLLRLDLSEAPSFTAFTISSTDTVQIYEMYTSNI